METTVIERFKLFNKAKIFLENIIMSCIEDSSALGFVNEYYVHGGQVLLSFINPYILNTISFGLEKDVHSNEFIDCLYTDDFDIVVSEEHSNKIGEIINVIKNTKKKSPMRDFWSYLKYLICNHMNIEYEEYDFDICDNISNGTNELIEIHNIWIAIRKKTGENVFRFKFADITLCTKDYYVKTRSIYPYTKRLTIIDYIVNDLPNIVERIKQYKIELTKSEKTRDPAKYVSNINKRYLRILLLLNAITTNTINVAKIGMSYDTYQNELGRHRNKLIELIDDVQREVRTENSCLSNYFVFQYIDKNSYNIYFYINDIISLTSLLAIQRVENTVFSGMTPIFLNTSNTMFPPKNITDGLNASRYNVPMVNAKSIKDMYAFKDTCKEYIDDLYKLDFPYKGGKLIKQYSASSYTDINNRSKLWIYDPTKAMNKPSEDDQGNMQIKQLIDSFSEKYNKKLFDFGTVHEKQYAYRSEWYTLIGKFSGYYDIDVAVNKTIITPSITSCGIIHPTTIGSKFVLLRIRYDENAKFLYILDYSTSIHEKEIIFPAGTIFTVTKITESYYSGEYELTIDLDCVGNIAYNNLKEFGEKYRRYLETDFVTYAPSSTKTVVQKGFQELLAKLSVNRKIPYKIIKELSSIEPYKELKSKIVSYSKFPEFDTDQAYLGEKLRGNKSSFCRKNVNTIIHTEPTNFVILTYNVHNFVKICNPQGRNHMHIINAIKEILDKTHIDIVCMQEVTPIYLSKPTTRQEIEAGSFSELVDQMSKLGFTYHICTNSMWDTDELNEDYYIIANFIFSKHLPTSVTHFGLPNNRCAQLAKIRHNSTNNEIYILNTQLEFRHGLTTKSGKNVLQTQIQCLCDIIENYNKSHPFFIAGDFNNDIVTDPIFEELNKLCKPITPTSDTSTDISGFNTSKIIDYILQTNKTSQICNIVTRLIIQHDASDHYPVMSGIRIHMSPVHDLSTKDSRMRTIYSHIYVWVEQLTNVDEIKIGVSDGNDIIVGSIFNVADLPPFKISNKSKNEETFLDNLVSHIKILKQTNKIKDLIFENNVAMFNKYI